MAWILNLETTTTNCSVCLSKDGTLVAVREYNGEGYSHGEMLHRFIKEVLAEAGLHIRQLDAVAVSEGPGSYTGLRIGVSAAKGICFSLNIPLITLPTLEILARQLQVNEGVLVPMLDARRMEVYTAIYDHQYQLLEAPMALVIDESAFAEVLQQQQVYFLGNAVTKVAPCIHHGHAHFCPEYTLPSARQMPLMAEARFQSKVFADVAYFEPFYLKEFYMAKPGNKTGK